MKKYFILGVSLIVIAVIISFSLKQESPARIAPACSFHGSALAGKTVYVCPSGGGTCYQTGANKYNQYCMDVDIPFGSYWVTDGCTSGGGTYSGQPVQVNLCVSTPGNLCACN
jgi:hypothetical protein